MELNEEQRIAFERIQAGENIFLTGPAGAGKSYLVKHIVKWATEVANKSIATTALTGCAALLLGTKAKTLHSWAGIGLGREPVSTLESNVRKSGNAVRRWRKTAILVIDEISMITPELYEKLDTIGKRLRLSPKPWGGIQLVLCGDFFQLPPVSKGISGEMPGRFVFEWPVWVASELKPALLTQIVRQTDIDFQTLLNECRIGRPSEASIELLNSRQGLDWKEHKIRPTLLFSRNVEVDNVNKKNLDAIKAEKQLFKAKTVIRYELDPDESDEDIPTDGNLERHVQKLDDDANYTASLELKVGCQVMLIVNLCVEEGYVNGSRGVIVDFEQATNNPIVQFLQGPPKVIMRQRWKSSTNKRVVRSQIPLRVAYAATIHKSQGATLDCALVDIGASTFEYGQAYVALSRVRNLESLYIWGLDPSRIRAHPAVKEFYETLQKE
jgi:ATP-dependent DNA helicase PIF1